MGRFSPGHSYGHHCRVIQPDDTFEISWVVDFYYQGSRLRYPRTFRRITDTRGARRFCKRWELPWEERQEGYDCPADG